MPKDSRVNLELKKFRVGKVFPHYQIEEIYSFLTDILVHRKDHLITIEEKNHDIHFFEWENQFIVLSNYLKCLV